MTVKERQQEVQSKPRRSEAKDASDARDAADAAEAKPASPGGTVPRLGPECRSWGASDAIHDQATVQDVVPDGSSAPLRSSL